MRRNDLTGNFSDCTWICLQCLTLTFISTGHLWMSNFPGLKYTNADDAKRYNKQQRIKGTGHCEDSRAYAHSSNKYIISWSKFWWKGQGLTKSHSAWWLLSCYLIRFFGNGNIRWCASMIMGQQSLPFQAGYVLVARPWNRIGSEYWTVVQLKLGNDGHVFF